MTGRRWLKPEEVAEDIKVNVKTLANWRSAKIGPPYAKINGVVRYDGEKYSQWLDAQLANGGGAA